ncbi:putative fatty acyl-CoA reductase CG5065 [Phlebotomus papatasi]|uniref:putative fatty acyl-CoA reductase CG5065 n=1 Tax=Phlebotomus papatasi TaxID=29031 RepID=UPI0024843C51|nr:putative fatty acyl-CoA reductase CG5065 [Phlebotomus papatasi]
MKPFELPAIADFFRGREIFITGGTGFLGKAIIEKILYSCPDVKRIYLLLRCKKSVSVCDRLVKFKSNQIFNRVRERDESLLDKIEALPGDSMCLKLGLSEEDIEKMENVSVIINSAASVRFDEPLGQAVFMNTRSARELCLIAEKLKNLKVLVHISTTYCNTNYPVIEEKVYPPLADWRETIKMAESVDTDILEIIAKKYMDFQPNTYTFTKHLAEQIMNEWSGKLPIIIFRPSIITPSVKEPFEGWVDNFNGITGILAAGGSGLARALYGSTKVKNNFQPLDVCVRSLLVATWKRGRAIGNEMAVYNCACSKEREVQIGEVFSNCCKICVDVPLDEMIWLPNATLTTCFYFYKIILFLFQVFPGMIFDLVLKMIKKKPIALFIMRKFHFASSSLSYFMFRDWLFVNDNCFNLMNDIKNEDMEAFGFDFYESIGIMEYMYQSSLGGRRYLMNQPDENLPRARRNYRIFWLLDRGVKLISWTSLIYFLITRFDLLNFSKDNILLQQSLNFLNISSSL